MTTNQEIVPSTPLTPHHHHKGSVGQTGGNVVEPQRSTTTKKDKTG